ncbi:MULTISPECIES: hypothetical protein [Planktothricoides]|uniref:Uncharacterized protein n=1 Tax=Planktothricoides raciborskii FACHB-1370 TaxID=2949576 RepID=A0ABR8EDU3_9CYAN|nr:MULTISPECIES: hypothetical protein [Planktothricoides]MBD2545019.1 hypothetical protein [Planktothricoides raciborskii FACHB-1370]
MTANTQGWATTAPWNCPYGQRSRYGAISRRPISLYSSLGQFFFEKINSCGFILKFPADF